MKASRNQFGRVVIALIGVLLDFAGPVAFSSDAAAASPAVSPPVIPCSLAQPGSITQALVCANKAEAMRQLDEAACRSVDAGQALEVLMVWRGREALPEDAAARNPVIAVFMAGCLINASVGAHGIKPPEASASMYLRKALDDPNDGIVGAAMNGLLPVLTPADVPTFVGIGSKRPALAVPSVAMLNTLCDARAKAGVQSIRATYAGSPKGIEIDQYLAQTRELCDAAGHPIDQQFTAQAQLAVPTAAPSAAEVKEALESQPPAATLRLLLMVPCAPKDTDVISEMRAAWKVKDTPGASAATRDAIVQAIIAACLIRADAASTHVTQETLDAAALLRVSIRGDDVMAVVAAVEGLAIVNAEQDIRLIADVPKRIPALLNHVIKVVGITCGANNLKTIALIQREAASKALRERINLVYGRVKPVRVHTCGAGR